MTEPEVKQEVFIPVTDRPPAPGDKVTGSILGLPAYSAVRVVCVVVNTHYQGRHSAPVDVFTPEGSEFEYTFCLYANILFIYIQIISVKFSVISRNF